MQLTFDTSTTRRFDLAVQYEWLETNGLGGYASSTIIGTNTRRYHGLLVAAMEAPVGRTVLLSKLDETVYLHGHTYELGTNKYQGAIYPSGYIFQPTFQQEVFPTFQYEVKEVRFKKTIVAVHGENTTLVMYEVQNAPAEGFDLELLPFTTYRDYHSLEKAHQLQGQEAHFNGETLRFRYQENTAPFYLSVPQSSFHPAPDWYFNLEYPVELERGMDGHEDLFSPGRFKLHLHEGQKIGIIISVDDPSGRDPWEMMQMEYQRREELVRQAGFQRPLLQQLVRAADQFIVQRDGDLRSIIAGYPWFSDWGRDSMIALPGLCLATGRIEDAEKILEAFARSTSEGMLPNRFPDQGQEPEYNTIDATLWFFVALYKYFKAVPDPEVAILRYLPVMKEILAWHQKGTRYNIHMAEDGLLCGGIDGVQLTWMDAKVDNWVVTPRVGKAVEINALWYNAWEIYAWALQKSGRKKTSEQVHQQARSIRRQFVKTFWNVEEECLFDVINGEHIDASVRPNQLFAISLPYALVSKSKAEKILQKVERHLFTPVGLRSLSPQDKAYRPYYGGDRYQRDGAYHQGTVWGWLIGPYLDAVIHVRGSLGKAQAKSVLMGLEEQLYQNGIGTLSEIYDGEAPWAAKGCIAQAWSVSEVLRIVAENKLFQHQHVGLPASFLEIPQRYLFS